MALKPSRLYLSSLLFRLMPPGRGHKLKTGMLRWCGATVGGGCEIMSSVRILGDFDLELGDNCFIGHEALLMGASGSSIVVEDNAKVGTRAILVTGFHEYSTDPPCVAKGGKHADIRVCAGAVVSTGVTVLPGITVNAMSHVVAGAVVTHDVPAYHRVGGIPARPIRDLRD